MINPQSVHDTLSQTVCNNLVSERATREFWRTWIAMALSRISQLTECMPKDEHHPMLPATTFSILTIGIG